MCDGVHDFPESMNKKVQELGKMTQHKFFRSRPGI